MKKISLDKNRVISLYKSGKTCSEIATIFNCSKPLINKRLSGWGVTMRDGRVSVDVDRLISLYKSGMSENAVSKKLGFSRQVIRRRLIENGVHIRNQSEAETLKWSQMSDKERSNQVEAANEKIRNMPKEFHINQAIKQAKTKQKTLSKVGDLEMIFKERFEEKGFEVIPQKAVYVYNIDLAIRNTAIEIHVNSAHPHSHSYYRKRIVELLKRDWNVIYIKILSDLSIKRATEKVCRMINLIESDKANVCQYGVIRGSGQLIASGCLNGDKFSTIDTPNGFFDRIK